MKLKQIKKVVCCEKSEIGLILIYSLVAGIFTLIVPIAGQALVTFVSFGQITQPLYLLALLVFIALTLSSIFKLLQYILVENIQQKIFVHTALNLSKNLPLVSLQVFEDHRGTELTNRYFDIFLLQKSVAILLIGTFSIFLQAIFGMMLLATYHPLLLGFDLVYTLSVLCILFLPFKSALKTALLESSAKYQVAAWIEEISRLPLLFKFCNYPKFAFEIADSKIFKCLKYRQSHFKKLLHHAVGGYVLQILGSTSLILLGGFLVIKNQLTLGQLVASEIVVASLGDAAQKLSKNMEDLYDLLAASDKLNFLRELPLDKNDKLTSERKFNYHSLESAPEIIAKDIYFAKGDGQLILSNINFTVPSGDNLAVYGKSGQGKTVLTRLLLGLYELQKGDIFYNEIPIKNYDIHLLRKQAAYICGIQVFDGSIIENILMNHNGVNINEIYDFFKFFEIFDVITSLPKGVETNISDTHHLISQNDLILICFARAFFSRSNLLIIDGVLDLMPDNYTQKIIRFIKSSKLKATTIVTTQSLGIFSQFDNSIRL